jgi:hypothetical protein
MNEDSIRFLGFHGLMGLVRYRDIPFFVIDDFLIFYHQLRA